MHRLTIRTASVVALLAAALAARGQSDPATIARILDEGKNRSQIMRRMEVLTKRLGPRLTGSPRLARAQEWAMDEFRKMGLKNVRLEEWGEVPVGWDRGPMQVARMVAPFESEMVFTTPAWTNGTKGIVRGRVVRAPMSLDELNRIRPELKGAWVLVPGPTFVRPGAPAAPARPPAEVMDALEKEPIAGRIYGSRNELVVTGGTWRDKTFQNHPGTPMVIVRKSDYDRLDRNLYYGRPTAVEIGAENRWYRGPVKQYNVVADLPGTEKPDEYVIVSGHFDSWNGPGSEGAQDDGTGSMTAMEAARILTTVGARPKRTIRFILWGGEEQGLFGSREYVRRNPDLLPKISAVLVDDGGTGFQGGYVGIASQKETMEAAFAPTLTAFPDLPMTFRVAASMPRGGGSDHAPFNAVGVPAFFTMEGGDRDYGYIHHTQNDRLDQVVPSYLIQSATNHAVVAYGLASAPTMLPRAPAPAAQPQGE